jgi:hypothetical protein
VEIEKIVFSSETEFHMLRHFEKLNTEQLAYFISKGYDIKSIQEQLDLPGSKFFPAFAEDISTILQKIKKWDYEVIESAKDRIVVGVEAPQSVGSLAVIPIANLSELEFKAVYKKNNRGTKLFHLVVDELPFTNVITLILKPNDGSLQLITAFPGEAGMPIPNKKMNKELFDHSKKYWAEHVFLERSKT